LTIEDSGGIIDTMKEQTHANEQEKTQPAHEDATPHDLPVITKPNEQTGPPIYAALLYRKMHKNAKNRPRATPNEETNDEKERKARFVEKTSQANWKKTTYIQPHEYTTQDRNPELLEEASSLIGTYGYTDKFMGREYTYLEAGRHKYWRLGTILNRQELHGD
jgi:hypothetical protein